MLVHPSGVNVHINKDPPSGGAFPATLESGVQVLLSAVMAQRQPDPGEVILVIPGWTIEVPE
jgi:hypothetical protein